MTAINRETAPYFVHVNWAGAVFVKEGDFFRSQGGLVEPWGAGWTAIAATSIGDARRKGAALFGVTLSPIHRGEP